VQTQNRAGGTAGRPEAGDTIRFVYSEQMAAASILNGWSGAATPVTVRIANGGGSLDTVTVRNAANTGQLPIGLVRTRAEYTGSTVSFTGSSMSMSGGTIVVTLGTQSANPKTDSSSPAMTWTPSASATDRAGNPCSAAAATQSGTVGRNF
jgi:hypothetical protein